MKDISPKTIVQWTQYSRDIFSEYFINNPRTIGGPGIEIEIDETSITKRKYNVGRFPGHQRQWMFGGIERGSGLGFVKLVDTRDAATLLPIIQEFIRSGSIIHSDLRRAYGGITVLPQGYQHLTENYQMNFVDPTTGAYTQNVESQWTRFKKLIKKSYGLNIATNDYL